MQVLELSGREGRLNVNMWTLLERLEVEENWPPKVEDI